MNYEKAAHSPSTNRTLPARMESASAMELSLVRPSTDSSSAQVSHAALHAVVLAAGSYVGSRSMTAESLRSISCHCRLLKAPPK